MNTVSAAPKLRLADRRPVILGALLLVYPLGVVWLWKSRRPRIWEKIAGSLFFAPVFGFLVLMALKPYWDFGGAMKLRDFSIDLSKGRWHYHNLEDHRRRQRDQPPPAPDAPSADLALAWPEFRGPRRDGVCEPQPISLDWAARPPREIYRQPVGEGYASFAVGRGRAYTIEQRREREVVVCYDFATGREVWAFDYPAAFRETLGGDGPRATPTLHGDRLYALGAVGHLHCLDTRNGGLVWRVNVLDEFRAENLHWGMSASPLVVDDKVIVTNSGKNCPSVLAYAAADGRPVWKSDVGVQGYSSPVLATVAGRRQILNLAASALNGIDPGDGRLLWSFPWRTEYGINVCQPLCAGPAEVFIASGYGHGAALIRLVAASDTIRAQEVWSSKSMKNKFTSSVLHNGHAFGLDEGILCCVDLATGRRTWKAGRYGHGSVLLVGDHLLVLGEEGQLVLVAADPAAHRELGRLQILHGRTWNNFVLVGGRLLARNHKEMVLYDLRP